MLSFDQPWLFNHSPIWVRMYEGVPIVGWGGEAMHGHLGFSWLRTNPTLYLRWSLSINYD